MLRIGPRDMPSNLHMIFVGASGLPGIGESQALKEGTLHPILYMYGFKTCRTQCMIEKCTSSVLVKTVAETDN